MHRTYENNDLVVFWNSEKCFHSKRCVTGSPKTFDINRKPWIDLGQAESSEIWQAISKCPSGALKVIYRHDIEVKMDTENHRSAAYDGDKEIGECEYSADENGWCIYHTGVRDSYEGKGIARRLVYKVLEASERAGATLTATCSYAVKVLGE